jgi:hypothetical protein
MIAAQIATPQGPSVRAAGLCETSATKKIRPVLELCEEFGAPALIVGPPGCGKTTTLRDFADAQRFVYLITLEPATGTLAAGLDAIVHATGGSTWYDKRGPSTKVRSLKEKLARDCENKAKGKPVLIIDEAQHGQIDLIEQLRSLHDGLGCGLVLAGNDGLQRRFFFSKGAPKPEFEPINSRLLQKVVLPAETPKTDIEALCRHHGADDPGRMADTLRRFAGRGKGLRTIDRILTMARRVTPVGALTVESVLKIARVLESGEEE